jgi:peptide chain release factor subunit 1
MNRDDVEKLLTHSLPEPLVWSGYVSVPADPAELRGLPAHVGGMFAAAATALGEGGEPRELPLSDQETVLAAVGAHAQDWMGHSVAIFICGKLGLFETVKLPCEVAERTVLATRPYVRPLLAALRRCPSYGVAVVDRRYARIFRIAGETIAPVANLEGEAPRGHRFGGWYGLESHRINERVLQLARRHYHQTAAALEKFLGRDGCEVFVAGGHTHEVAQFLGVLSHPLRRRFAGSFVADPHTATPARVRDLADAAIARWEDAEDRRLADGAKGDPAAVTGLEACVHAANQHAVGLLIVPDDEEITAGFTCAECGALGLSGGACSACGAERSAVVDIVEELVVKVLHEGGRVEPVRDAARLGGVAARLRFPLPPD